MLSRDGYYLDRKLGSSACNLKGRSFESEKKFSDCKVSSQLVWVSLPFLVFTSLKSKENAYAAHKVYVRNLVNRNVRMLRLTGLTF